MKYTSTFLYLCVSLVGAVQYHGFAPSIELHDLLQGHANTFNSDSSDYEVTHMISTGNRTGSELSDFYANTFIGNETLQDLIASSSRPSGLVPRAPVNVACNGVGKVEDKLGAQTVNQICYGMATLAAASVAGVGWVLNSKVCNAADSGVKTFCQVTVVMTGAGAEYLGPSEVKEFCPQFMNLFVKKCDGKGGSGNANGSKIQFTEKVSQNTQHCSDLNVPCKESNQ
ncbi:hypothetical protein CBS147325_2975 [Penicillium roqueforti]|nr:hypothetical protein CBS147325_2975 [Penicillium roqueforti]KAI3159380.1 hypothetical protein DTO046C5_7005 [Penicillium roqueforti]